MTVPAVWDPSQYHRYGDLRLRPALELFARVDLEKPSLVHDIGTGGGEIARLMATRWPEATVIGSDHSPEMLAEAAAVESPVEWRELDIAGWQPAAEHDLIFGNAVLHWLDDHYELFPRLMAGLVPGGQLAVQMPMSWWQPSHRVIRQTLAALPGAETRALRESMQDPNVHRPELYYEILQSLASEIDIWETTYQQILAGDDPVYEWVSGSILRPVLSRLRGTELAEFVDLCRAGLRTAYPQQADGTTLFPFHRLFIIARR